MNPVVVTIDGPSGAGKSTITKQIAAKLMFTYLDTGAMYRAVGLKIHRTGTNLDDRNALQKLLDTIDLHLVPDENGTRTILDEEDVSEAIRTPEMSMIASRVSADKLVREKLTLLQRNVGQEGSIVAEGRDMGTVVFPKANHKFFLDASPEERARRRQKQLAEQGQEVDFKETLEQIIKRDKDDSSRALSPLKPAEDAIIIESSEMTIDEVVDFMVKYIQR